MKRTMRVKKLFPIDVIICDGCGKDIYADVYEHKENNKDYHLYCLPPKVTPGVPV